MSACVFTEMTKSAHNRQKIYPKNRKKRKNVHWGKHWGKHIFHKRKRLRFGNDSIIMYICAVFVHGSMHGIASTHSGADWI